MRISAFRIENFRNLKLAECAAPPDFMVICGGNGSGKSALLSALMTAKEYAGAYGNFTFDPRAVSADAKQATISLSLEFSEIERRFVKDTYGEDCPEKDEIVIEIQRGGGARAAKRSNATKRLLSSYSRSVLGSPGFFDYIDAHRPVPKVELSTWDAGFLSDERAKGTLGATGAAKFQHTKSYLAGLAMRDIQEAQASHRAGKAEFKDSLKPIREFFDGFFAPMRFRDVLLHQSPFQYIIETPRGVIDLDDLSSGEKEVLNTYIRFHQLAPKGAVILFDEADAHLHPDLERRYLQVLREIGEGNQLWITAHSPEMMIAAGSEGLYSVLKESPGGVGNQFVRVTSTESLHDALSEVMGSRGLISFNQRIVFIEGTESSADREVYEKLYPPSAFHVSFVPAGDSGTVRKTAERVNDLLSSSITFQHYFAIVDGDLGRAIAAPATGGRQRLFTLPVYHIENFLLDESLILSALKDLLAGTCPYANVGEVLAELKALVVSDDHVKPYTKALQDSRLAAAAKAAWDSVFTGNATQAIAVPTFAQTEVDARALLAAAVADGSWKARCKGRDVLKAISTKCGVKYVHLRNLITSKMASPPPELDKIMKDILA